MNGIYHCPENRGKMFYVLNRGGITCFVVGSVCRVMVDSNCPAPIRKRNWRFQPEVHTWYGVPHLRYLAQVGT